MGFVSAKSLTKLLLRWHFDEESRFNRLIGLMEGALTVRG